MINIQEFQISEKENEICKSLLEKGVFVTSYEVTKRLNDFFEHYIPGLPYFKPINIKAYSKSDKDVYNKMFNYINNDLNTLYSVYNSQSDYAVLSQSTHDIEMEMIHKELDYLVMQSEILDDYSKKKLSYHPYIICFNNLKDTNTNSLNNLNIPMTTSEIDFNTSTLRNEIYSTPNDKLDLTKCSIKISSNGFKIKTNKDIKNILNDLYSETVSITAEGTVINKMADIILDIDLIENKDISRIDLIGYSLYNTKIRLFLSNDGVNFFDKEISEGKPDNIWRFNKENVKAVKIIIQKEYADKELELNKKLFYFILKNISIYNDKYAKSSVFTSEVIEFPSPISDIVINPINQMPPATDIAYFVGVENSNKSVDWKPIVPNELLDLKTMKKEEMILNYFTSEDFGSWDFNRITNDYNFFIHTLPVNTNYNSINLRAGHSQWLIERLDVIPNDDKANIKDYNKTLVTEIAPLDATIMEIKCENTNNYFVMSQYIIVETDTIVQNRYFKFNKTRENFDVIVMLNGKQVLNKNDKYAFKLRKGENLLQLMIVLNNLDVSNTEYIKTIKHNFNLMSYAKEIYAGPKMQRISYNSLSKNVSNHSLKYYALKTENGRDKIVTKFDPNYILKPTDPQLSFKRDLKEKENISTEFPLYTPSDIKMNNSEYFRMYLKFKHKPVRLTDEDFVGDNIKHEYREFFYKSVEDNIDNFENEITINQDGFYGNIPRDGDPFIIEGEYVEYIEKTFIEYLTRTKESNKLAREFTKKIVSEDRDSFPDKVKIYQDGFEGTITKTGSAKLIRGEHIQAQSKISEIHYLKSKTNEFPYTTFVYEEEYKGEIPLHEKPYVSSGVIVEDKEKSFTRYFENCDLSIFPQSYEINEEGFIGEIKKYGNPYVIGGYLKDSVTKEFNGRYIGASKDDFKETYPVNENGFKGELKKFEAPFVIEGKVETLTKKFETSIVADKIEDLPFTVPIDENGYTGTMIAKCSEPRRIGEDPPLINRNFEHSLISEDKYSFPLSIPINKDGYIGDIYMDGEPFVYSGDEYFDEYKYFYKSLIDTDENNFPDTIDVNEDGFIGTISKYGTPNVISGEIVESITKSFEKSLEGNNVASFPQTFNINEDGYVGDIPKSEEPIVIGGSLGEGTDKVITDSKTSTSEDDFPITVDKVDNGVTYTLDKDGEPFIISDESSPEVTKEFEKSLTDTDENNFPDTVDINENGFVGSIGKNGSPVVISGSSDGEINYAEMLEHCGRGSYRYGDIDLKVKKGFPQIREDDNCLLNFDTIWSIPHTNIEDETCLIVNGIDCFLKSQPAIYAPYEVNRVSQNFSGSTYGFRWEVRVRSQGILIEVTQYVTTVAPRWEIGYLIYNKSGKPVNIGLRMSLNPVLGRDGQSEFILGNFKINNTIESKQKMWTGSQVPNEFYYTSDDAWYLNPVGTLKGAGIVRNPDSFGIGGGSYYMTRAGWTPKESSYASNSYVVCWNEVSVDQYNGTNSLKLNMFYGIDKPKDLPPNDTRVWQQDYKGSISKPGSGIIIWQQNYKKTITIPGLDTRVWRQYYRGDVTIPGYDSRVFEQNYEGSAFKEGEDTRVWQQNYFGTLSIEEVDNRKYVQDYNGIGTKVVDTRVWQQNYKGILTREGSDTRVWKQKYFGTLKVEGYDTRTWTAEYKGIIYTESSDSRVWEQTYSDILEKDVLPDEIIFPDSVEINEEGFKGDIPKVGEPEVIGGDYLPEITKEFNKSLTSEDRYSFPVAVSIKEDGFDGLIGKSGIEFSTQGKYIPDEYKAFTRRLTDKSISNFPSCVDIDENGFIGTIPKSSSPKVITGELVENEDKEFSESITSNDIENFPERILIDKNGFTGSIYKYGSPEVVMGCLTPSYSIDITDEMESYDVNSFPDTITKTENGVEYILTKDGEPVIVTRNYDVGYTDVKLSANVDDAVSNSDDSEIIWKQKYKVTIEIPATDTRVWQQEYKGTLSKPGYDTRVWEQLYEGSLIKEGVDTRVWQQDYKGELIKKGIDTRIWQQKYEGPLRKPGYDTRVWQQNYRGTLSKIVSVEIPKARIKTRVRLMARLTTSDISVTPTINAIKVVGQ